MSAPALFRWLELAQPTLLLDELDTWFVGPRADDVAGLLNDGFQRDGRVVRCVGDKHDVQPFAVFCAKAFAGIGVSLADATRSRCIRLPMQRATAQQQLHLLPLRTDHAKRWSEPLQQRLARVAQDYATILRETLNDDDAVPMPSGIDGRDAQVWEPLLAVADLAGGRWPELARDAAVALVRERRNGDDGDVGMRLLADLRSIFDDIAEPSATSETLCNALNTDESKGWQKFGNQGKPINAHGLARVLKRFDRRPKQIRQQRDNVRLWLRIEFEAVWERYLPDGFTASSSDAGTSATTGTMPTALAPTVPTVPLVPVDLGDRWTQDGSAHGIAGDPLDSVYWEALCETRLENIC